MAPSHRPAAPLPTTESIEPLLSLPSDFESTGVHHGYRQATVAHRGEIVLPEFSDLLDSFQPVAEAWLSWIEPGGFIVCHRDAGPHRERWQIPLTGHGALNGDRPTPGEPFQVHHDRWHHVRNDSDGPRVSLVIDRDVIASPTASPFSLCPQGRRCRSDHE